MIQNLSESVKIVKNALEANGVYPDAIGKNKDGHIVVRDSFFYKSGRTSEGHAYKVKKALDAAGLAHSIVDRGEHNAPFRGGASVAQGSHFYTHVKLHEDEINEGHSQDYESVVFGSKSNARNFAADLYNAHPSLVSHVGDIGFDRHKVSIKSPRNEHKADIIALQKKHSATGSSLQEAYPTGAAMSRKAKAVKQARAVATGYANQKSGKWASQSYKLPDGRWASKDVQENQIAEASLLKQIKRVSNGWGDGINVASVKDDTNGLSKDSLEWTQTRKVTKGSPGHLQQKLAARKLKEETGPMSREAREYKDAMAAKRKKQFEDGLVAYKKLVKWPPMPVSKEIQQYKDAMAAKRKKQFEDGLVAYRKSLGGPKNKNVNEDIEQIDELSRATLGSYVKKASNSVASKAVEYGTKKAERDEVDRITNRHMRYADKDNVHQALNTTSDDVEAPRVKAAKRIGGINMAVDKLVKESLLERYRRMTGRGSLHEVSPSLLKRYMDGAENDIDQLNKKPKLSKPLQKKMDRRTDGWNSADARITKAGSN